MTDRDELLVDTSVAIALVVADHAQHSSTSEAVWGRRLGLAGHAAFEAYSVLTRLPAPLRRTPSTVQRLLAETFPATRHLGARESAEVLRELARAGIAGGAVYDALVAAAARASGLTLVTRDRRALVTYQSLGADVRLVA